MRTFQARFLFALALIGILPLAVVGLGIALLDSRAITEQSTRELTGLARGLAGQLDVHLSELFSATRAIAALPEVVSMDRGRQGELLKELFHHYSNFSRISTFDRSGQRLASSHPGGVPSIAVRKSFQGAVKSGHQEWEVGHALSSGRSSLLIHTPIRAADRRVVGVVGAVVDLESLSAVVGRVPVGGGGRAFVLDPDGRVLLHPDRTAVQERRDYSWLGVPSEGRVAGPGTVRYESEGVAHVAGYASVPNVGWTIFVERPEKELLLAANRSWYLALAGLAISSFLALLTAFFLARKLTGPVSQLAAAARALGGGSTDVPLPMIAPGEGELGTLVKAFREMQQAVRGREDALQARAHEAMAAEAKFRGLLESAPDAIVTSDREGRILLVNSQSEKMFGYSRDELVGKPVEILVPEALRQTHVAHRKTYYDDPRTRTMGMGFWYDLSARRKDGSAVPVDIGLSPLQIDGQLLITAVIRDITEHKRANEELRKKTVELERSNKVKDEFLSVMSHELRTPLTAVMGYASMMQDKMLGEINQEQEKTLGRVLKQSNDLLTLINSIMQASALEANAVNVKSERVNLGSFLNDLMLAYNVPLHRDLSLLWDYPSELPEIMTDSDKLRQILQNLINNAIKFTEKGSVTVSVTISGQQSALSTDPQSLTPNPQTPVHESRTTSHEPRGWVEFKVADTGVGIPPENLPAIFDKFRQVDSSETRLYGGVGMGLYIVKQFITLLGGQVKVESEPGKGSTFTMRIPESQN